MAIDGNGIGWKVIGPGVVGILLLIVGYITSRGLVEIDRISMIQAQRGTELHYIWEEIKRIDDRLDRLERR